jgi:hypothetical protein
MLVTHVSRGSGDQAGHGVNEFASLVEVGRAAVFGEPAVHGGNVQEFDRVASYDLDSGYIGEICDLLISF